MRPEYSRMYLWSSRAELDISEGQGQLKPSARIAAEADPRNAYSEALLFNAFQPGLAPVLILNADATQYRVAVSGDGETKLVWVRDPGDRSPSLRRPRAAAI